MSAREDIEALLPFLANETLEGAERAEVEAAVAEDVQLASELAALRAIRANMQAEDSEASPGELGLARLMRDIDQEVQATPAPVADNDNVVPMRRLRMWQAAAAIVLALGLGQAVLTNAPDTPAPGSEFGLASGMDGPEAAAFRVIFAPETSEADMRNLLLEAGLEIVAGPSSLGFYDLAPLDGAAGLETARTALESADTLIETWEDVSN